MALKPCKSCKHNVDTSAKLCPSCGVADPGVTLAQKLGGLVVLGLIIAVVVSMCSGGSKDKPEEKVTQAADTPSYSITNDDLRNAQARKVEVMLPNRISEAELAQVAEAIRKNTKSKHQRTFIGFRVEGQTSRTYWANASFDPDLKSSVLGVSAPDYQVLKAMDLKQYPDRIGSWLSDGGLGHVKVLYPREGKYFIDLIYPNGEKGTEKYLGKKLSDGGLRLETPDNDFGEYYVVDASGNLQSWSENGNYLTLPPSTPGQI